MEDAEDTDGPNRAEGEGPASPGRPRSFELGDTRVALLGTLAIGIVIGALSVSGVSFFDATPPEPEIESVEILESGCHEDVTPYAMSSSRGIYVGSINDTSTHTEVSAEIRRSSRDDATVAAYRVHVETHNTTMRPDECPGRIVYRIEYDAPYPDAAAAMRTERYVDGEFRGCGSSSSGPETGCRRLHEERPVHYSNGTVEYEAPVR